MTLRFILFITFLLSPSYSISTVEAFDIKKWSHNHPKPSQTVLKLPSLSDSNTFTAVTTTSGISAMVGLWQPGIAMASVEVEVAELPPPWIPVVFGIGLIVVRSIRSSQIVYTCSLLKYRTVCCIH